MGSLLVCIEELVIATLVHCMVLLSVVRRMEGTRNRMGNKSVAFYSLVKRSSASVFQSSGHFISVGSPSV